MHKGRFYPRCESLHDCFFNERLDVHKVLKVIGPFSQVQFIFHYATFICWDQIFHNLTCPFRAHVAFDSCQPKALPLGQIQLGFQPVSLSPWHCSQLFIISSLRYVILQIICFLVQTSLLNCFQFFTLEGFFYYLDPSRKKQQELRLTTMVSPRT